MSSEEGLNAYGAVTWGNFSYIKDLMKIVDGCTLLNVDVADMYAEKLLLKMTNYSMNTMELLPVIEN
jgi:hypothetical protein